MNEILQIPLFPIVLTLLCYQIGLKIQQKLKSPLANPILIAVVLVLLVLSLTGLEAEAYRSGNACLSWLMTPATICLAIPMYEQFQVLRKSWKALAAGIGAGTVASLAMVGLYCLALGYDRTLTVSLLPKSVTSAIGVPLGELSGGIASVTTAVIIFTGILANSLAPLLIRLFRLRDEIAVGVALGTSGHVIGTARANELSRLTGAASSLSLVIAGLLTAVLLPIVAGFLA